ncbi:peptide ABC transporter substrate-binding protein [Lapidilactobacillus wuchangensis]|uniref:peptide ABC transporter substrate-binding protein n=1 Tax=Lapidilactobacillus wuchangensis TaxID=2486001 RepID=UPI000F779210|nr:peptide ABC transporter substrate-binding protein [Lapidilactobacillus wuchangensis]
MKWQKLAKLSVVALAVTTLLAACGTKKSSSGSADSKQVLTRMEGDVISSMDTSVMTDAISGQAAVDTMDGLYRYNGSELQPAIATKIVEPTNGGKTYTYQLRKDAKWSNGDPVTAQNFVYAWQRTVNPATKSQYAYLYSGIKNADDIMNGKKEPSTLGVTAKGEHTLVVELDHAIPYFKTMVVNPAFFPQNQKVVEKYGSKYGTTSEKTVYNGPFKLTGWTGTNNSWTEVKNKTYWNASKVKLDKVKVQVVKDSSTALNLFQSGKMDDVSISGETAQQMKNDPSYKPLAQATVFYLELNEKKVPAFKNVKIRQAISKAINRPEFVKNVLGDSSIPAANVTPQNLAKTADGEDFSKAAAKVAGNETKYDKTEAKKLWQEGLKEAGISDLSVEYLTDDTDGAKKSAEYFQSQLEKTLPGLKVKISTVPFKSRLTRSQSGDFDIVMTAWGADFPDPITFLDLFTTGNSYNNGNWDNAEYNKLIEASKTTDATNDDKRSEDLLKAQEILTKEQGVIPIYQRAQGHLVNSKVKDLRYSPANMYNFVGAYIAD